MLLLFVCVPLVSVECGGYFFFFFLPLLVEWPHCSLARMPISDTPTTLNTQRNTTSTHSHRTQHNTTQQAHTRKGEDTHRQATAKEERDDDIYDQCVCGPFLSWCCFFSVGIGPSETTVIRDNGRTYAHISNARVHRSTGHGCCMGDASCIKAAVRHVCVCSCRIVRLPMLRWRWRCGCWECVGVFG